MKQQSISDFLHITGNIIIEGSKFVNQIEKNINGNKKMQKKKKKKKIDKKKINCKFFKNNKCIKGENCEYNHNF